MESRLLDSRTRFFLGGIGGLAPILLFLVNLDFERYIADATTWRTVGYVVRAILLFLIGGFVAYLHDSEKKRITLFLVGVSAPSLIAGYLSTANPSLQQRKTGDTGQNGPVVQFLVSSAFAQAPRPSQTPAPAVREDVRRFTLPPQTASSKFFEGLLGLRPKNVWFVIVASHLNVNDAKKEAATLNQKFPGYHAEVYAPYADNPYYAVVIGAHLTQGEAKALRDRAVHDGLNPKSYYKTFPGLPPPE
jgi:hypothetical protein